MTRDEFRVLVVDLGAGSGEVIGVEGRDRVVGGSGLAAHLFTRHAAPGLPWNDPAQPLVFAVGPLTGLFPLMSKTVCAFKSPYHDQYAESHAGGRSALSLRLAGLDALVVTGRAPRPSCIAVGSRHVEVKETHYLWGRDLYATGKLLRGMFPGAGHRSILRIGPAGESGSAMACINVDTYRHFGRLGSGAAMGAKNLKAIVIQGDGSFPLEGTREYPRLFQEVHEKLTGTDMMGKYHDLGTPVNMAVLNEARMLPVRNLQSTSDPAVAGITGERFAEQALLRNAACAGCPVGCIHIGFVRERFQREHQYLYRQVAYDHEPIFAMGSMLGVTDCFAVLTLLDAVEKVGLDVMSAGVALAWATEALAKGLVSPEETIVPLAFGDAGAYEEAVWHLGTGANDFYRLLGQGTLKAAARHGGGEFACVLGQEMAGYATGEVFFTSQALGLRHSHLDSGGYSYDQKERGKDPAKAVAFLVEDERSRVLLTSMVACLFARGVYTEALLADCLRSVGRGDLAGGLGAVSRQVQRLRWQARLATGYRPEDVTIPQRFLEVTTGKGPIDAAYLESLKGEYARAIRALAGDTEGGRA